MARKALSFIEGVIILACLITLVLIVMLSCFTYYKYPLLMPQHFFSEYWTGLFYDNGIMRRAFVGTVLIGAVTASISTVLGFLTAFGMVQMGVSKSERVRFLLTLPLFIPYLALCIGIHVMLLSIGITGTWIGTVLGLLLLSLPYSVLIAISSLEEIPSALWHAAHVLGASRLQYGIHVMLPIVKSGMIFTFGLSFIISVSDYFLTFLTGGGRVMTLGTIYLPYVQNSDDGRAAVISLIFLCLNGLSFWIVALVMGYFGGRRELT